ncbi:transporter, CPA2 family [Chryseobacterium formosense]|uniref:cation:proton antiporter n=1 Tax=Chryseobacterium formosense TaxID=236814 RepID=UPI0008E71FAD|nr:cation:proton antiporter [Chryseobacterium formosense]SFT47212.1 transporter, CPA2 family [Chryseobacterium formosense]
MNELLWSICLLSLIILGMIFLLKKYNQPYLIAYIIAGIIMGPYVLGVFSSPDEIEAVGEIGILLLMFFLGMEINVPDNRSLLIKPIIAQGLKIILSMLCALLVGYTIGLSANSIVMMTILFMFNSTAVVSEFLKKHNTLQTALGIVVLNMLIFQDLLLAPVLTVLKTWNKDGFNLTGILLPIALCVSFFYVIKKVRKAREITLPRTFATIEYDHDLQVFLGLLLCLGFGLIAEESGLSAALGSFIAGVIVGRVEVFNWLEHSLMPFKIFFVTLFFVSIGLRLDIEFLFENYTVIFLGTLFVLVSNSVMSAIIFRFLKHNWKESWYGGALLSQTGEFGILALSVAYKTGIIEYGLYKQGLGITCLSLLFSTIWIAILNIILKKIPSQEYTVENKFLPK